MKIYNSGDFPRHLSQCLWGPPQTKEIIIDNYLLSITKLLWHNKETRRCSKSSITNCQESSFRQLISFLFHGCFIIDTCFSSSVRQSSTNILVCDALGMTLICLARQVTIIYWFSTCNYLSGLSCAEKPYGALVAINYLLLSTTFNIYR